MRNLLVYAIIFSLLGWSWASSAHDHAQGPSDKYHQVTSEMDLDSEGRPNPESLRDFVERAHHELELGNPHSNQLVERLKAVFAKLNPISVFLAAKRWHDINGSDPRFGEHAKNLAFLLPFSESLELMTGPAMTWLTAHVDWPIWLERSLLGTGYTVSIPFVVEPYCATLTFIYVSSPWVRRGVTRLRSSLTRGAKSACESLGIVTALRKKFPPRAIQSLFPGSEWLYEVRGQNLILFRPKGDAELTLELSHNSFTYIRRIRSSGYSRREFKMALRNLNWTAREILNREFREGPFELEFHPNEVRLTHCEPLLVHRDP